VPVLHDVTEALVSGAGTLQRSPAKARLTVAHVLAPAAYGGAEEVVRLLASGQAAAGHCAHIVPIVFGSDHPFHFDRSPDRPEVHPVSVGGRAYGRERAGVRSLLHELRPDIVHTHGYRSDVLDAPVARRLGVHTVSTAHGRTGGGWRNRLYERIQLHAFRSFDAVVAVSAVLEREIVAAGVARSRVHLIANAWSSSTTLLSRADARAALNIPADSYVVGWVGRLTQEKGPDVFLDALAQATDLPLTAAVIGDGAMRESLQQRARVLGLSERVRWCGAVPRAAHLFPAFDVFVISSRTEGTPISLFEALHARVPVVSTAVGGIPAVVSETEAWLVPPNDTAALAAAMRSAFVDRALADA
jgi:glycosyltransferase involved in cell wall biosynthesis